MNVESILSVSFLLALVASARDRNRVDMAGQDDSVNGMNDPGNNIAMAPDCSKWPTPRQLFAAQLCRPPSELLRLGKPLAEAACREKAAVLLWGQANSDLRRKDGRSDEHPLFSMRSNRDEVHL